MISGMCNGMSDPAAPGRCREGPRKSKRSRRQPVRPGGKNLAASKKPGAPIRIIVGAEDFTLAANEAFHARLTKLGIPHEYKILPNVSHGYKEYYEKLDFSLFTAIATH